MKNLKFRKLNLLYLLLVAVFLGGVFLGGCNYGQNYTYTYTAKVTYTDSAVDTLVFSYDSFKGNNVYVYLKITESGLIASGGTSPCLMVGCGLHTKAIACGVRKYEIINEAKSALNGY